MQSVTLHSSLGEVKIEVFCDQVPKASEVSPHCTYSSVRGCARWKDGSILLVHG